VIHMKRSQYGKAVSAGCLQTADRKRSTTSG
jgi:hypothetical protein